MNIDSHLLIAGILTGIGLTVLMIGFSATSSSSNVLSGLANYGEARWDERNLASGDMVQFETKRGSPIIRLFTEYASSRKKRQQARPGAQISVTGRRLMLAQIQLSAAEWTMLRMLLAAVVSALLFLRINSPLAIPIACAGVFFGTKMFLGIRVSRRQQRFERQLIDVIGVIGAGMRAGSTFNQAIEYVSEHVDAPAGPEFARLSREAQFGIPMDECLTHLAERNDSNELRLLVNALVVNRRVGGNMSSILEILADTIRMRIKIKGDIKTLTAQASFSGWIISLLPVGLLLLLMAISPAYIGPMFKSPIGLGMLGFGGFSVLMGMFLMRTVTKVKI